MDDETFFRWMAARWADGVYLHVVRLEHAVDRFHAGAVDEGFRAAYEPIDSPEMLEGVESPL